MASVSDEVQLLNDVIKLKEAGILAREKRISLLEEEILRTRTGLQQIAKDCPEHVSARIADATLKTRAGVYVINKYWA